jgi:hypothetical protein
MFLLKQGKGLLRSGNPFGGDIRSFKQPGQQNTGR